MKTTKAPSNKQINEPQKPETLNREPSLLEHMFMTTLYQKPISEMTTNQAPSKKV